MLNAIKSYDMKFSKGIIVLLTVLFSGTLFAQKEEFYVASLKQTTLLRGPKIYFEPLENRADDSFVDVNQSLQELVEKRTQIAAESGAGNRLVLGGLFTNATEKETADVVISGYYKAKSGSSREEYALRETGQHIGNPIPYFEWRKTNYANLLVVLTFTYADGTMQQDSLWADESDLQRAGRKLMPVSDLEEIVTKQFKKAFYYQFNFIEMERRWIDFPTVRVKDKALKAEYKAAKDLIKSYQIVELGRLYKKLYEAENTDEAAIGLGLCYEILGNYPAAAALFEGRTDFHIKARMKKEVALYDYLKEIGANLNLIEL